MTYAITEPNADAISTLVSRCTNFAKEAKAALKKKIPSAQAIEALRHYINYQQALLPVLEVRLADYEAQEEYEQQIEKAIYQESDNKPIKEIKIAAEDGLADLKPLKDKDVQDLLSIKDIAVEVMLHPEAMPLEVGTQADLDECPPQSNYYERLQAYKEEHPELTYIHPGSLGEDIGAKRTIPLSVEQESKPETVPTPLEEIAHVVEVKVVNLDYTYDDLDCMESEADAVGSTMARKIELEPEPEPEPEPVGQVDRQPQEVQTVQVQEQAEPYIVENYADIHDKLEQERVERPKVVLDDTELKRAVKELEGHYARITKGIEAKSISNLKPAITAIKTLIRKAFPQLIVGREILTDRDLLIELANKMLPFIEQELQVAKEKLESYVPIPVVEDSVKK